MHLHPAGDALVVGLGEIHAVPRRRLGNALSALRVPDGRVSHAQYPPALQPPVLRLHLADLRKYLVRRPLQARVGLPGAAVQLQNAVQPPVVVHGPPAAGEGLGIAPVKAPVDGPALRYLKRVDHMGERPVGIVLRIVGKLLKELPLKYVPVPLQPRPAQLVRQDLQLLDVVRLALHQRLVVRHAGLDKDVVLRPLAALKAPVHKQPLDVLVSLPAGVAGVVHPLGEVVDAAQARGNGGHLPLAQLCGLVQEDHVVLHALQPVQVAVLGAVGKADGAAVAEGQDLVLVVVSGHALQLDAQLPDVVVDQLRIGPPHDEAADTGIAQAQQLCLCPHGPAFPAAPGAAKGNMLLRGGEKQLLLLVGRLESQRRHTLYSSISPSSTFTPSSRPLPSSGLSRHLSGRLFFSQNICAVTSGAISFVTFFVTVKQENPVTGSVTFSLVTSSYLYPSALFRREFSTWMSTTSLPLFKASEISLNLFFQAYSVEGTIPILLAICSSVRPSLAQPSSSVRPSGSSHCSYLPFATRRSHHLSKLTLLQAARPSALYTADITRP